MSALGALLGLALLIFELVLVARVVLDWVGVLAPAGTGELGRIRRWTHSVTEPVIAPVRRVVRPLRVGSVSIDLAFTVVFVAVVVLRSVVLGL
ncbi:MAG: YggT family protein [Actinomycetota bacterium]|nr:YggT family protein [Actinomycetota bacterium]